MADEILHKAKPATDSPLSDPRFRPALLALAEAHALATAAGRSTWEFALEIQALGQIGTSYSQLRWLVAEELVEHRLETTRPNAATRTFRARRIWHCRLNRVSDSRLAGWSWCDCRGPP